MLIAAATQPLVTSDFSLLGAHPQLLGHPKLLVMEVQVWARNSARLGWDFLECVLKHYREISREGRTGDCCQKKHDKSQPQKSGAMSKTNLVSETK